LVLQAVTRWLRYNLVGMMGFAVQTLTLTLLLGWTGLPDLAALALAVVVALSHNFFWHERVTWPDRPREERFVRFARFQLSTGTLSLLSNLGLTKVVMLATGMPVLASNLLAVASASFVQFLFNDRVVFKA
jgi:putative flippase GtrA